MDNLYNKKLSRATVLLASSFSFIWISLHLFYASFTPVIWFMIGFTLYCFSAPHEGKNRELTLIIPIPYTNVAVHVHHWIYLTIVLTIAFSVPIVKGFCLGGITQSLIWYTDWYKVFINRNTQDASSSSSSSPQTSQSPSLEYRSNLDKPAKKRTKMSDIV